MPTIALFDPDLVVARLQAQVSALRKVSGAADFAAAQAVLRQTPAAFVIETNNRATPSRTGTEVVSQETEIRFGVILAEQNLRDPLGGTAKTAMNVLRESVVGALLGWKPEADYDPCEYATGRLLLMNDQVLWWQDEFVTRTLLRSV
jgi:hypothetical protein